MSENTGLAVIAHGSRNDAANREFLQLVCEIAGEAREYAAVRGCFLELAEPDLATAVDELIAAGCVRVRVYPLFFNQGKHVARDIPGAVDTLRQRHPDRTIELLPYFGSFNGLARLVHTHLQQLGE